MMSTLTTNRREFTGDIPDLAVISNWGTPGSQFAVSEGHGDDINIDHEKCEKLINLNAVVEQLTQYNLSKERIPHPTM